MAVHNRPDCLQRALEALGKAEGHAGWRLFLSVEPGRENVTWEIIESFKAMDVVVSSHSHVLGCDQNTFLAAALAMAAGSDYNLHLEDDIVISRDALLLCDWLFRPENKREYNVLALRRLKEDASKPNRVAPSHDGLLGCGWAWCKEDWAEHIRHWWLYYERGMPGKGWDLAMPWMLDKFGYRQWRPWVNRSKSIGYSGAHTPDGHFDPNMHGPCYDGLERGFSYG